MPGNEYIVIPYVINSCLNRDGLLTTDVLYLIALAKFSQTSFKKHNRFLLTRLMRLGIKNRRYQSRSKIGRIVVRVYIVWYSK